MNWFALQRHKEGGVRRKANFLQVFTFKVKGNRFLQVGNYLIQRRALSDDRNFHALGDVVGLPAPHDRFDGMLKLHRKTSVT